MSGAPEPDSEYESLMRHGVMTDEMRALADALGLREGKHTANSVARIARERLATQRHGTDATEER